QGTAARFSYTWATAADALGNVYVADTYNHVIRKITSSGSVSTLAGLNGNASFADGSGNAARFNYPQGISVDFFGNILVADTNNHAIRKITASGSVTTIAGTASESGATDGALALARFNYPQGVAGDSLGNIYVSDTNNFTIRKITSSGVVSTLAGSAGLSGSGNGVGAAARFYYAMGLVADNRGNVFVADRSNHIIRKITSDGTVSTFAGYPGAAGVTDGQGSNARFYDPFGICVDAAGNLYVTDQSWYTVRKITPGGNVTTIGGVANSYGSTNGVGNISRFYVPFGITVDPWGNLFVADRNNYTIRKGTPYTTSSLLGSSSLGAPTDNVNAVIDLGYLDQTAVLQLTGGSQTSTRGMNLAGTTGGAVLDLAGTGVTVLAGNVTSGGAGSKTLTLQGSGSGTGELAGSIGDNSAVNLTSVVKQGTGIWTLSGANTYSGGTTLAAGTLRLGSALALGTGSLVIQGGVSLDASGALTLFNSIPQVWNGDFTFIGSNNLTTGAGPITMANTTTVTVAAGSLNVAGSISGVSGLIKDGAGTLILSGTNTYFGSTQVLAGTLIFNGPGAMPAASKLVVGTSATVLLQNGAMLSVGADQASSALSTPLTGNGGLAKYGTGTLTVRNDNSYTGSTVIAGGTVAVETLNTMTAGSYAWSTLAGHSGVAGFGNGYATAAYFYNPRGVAVDASGTLYVADLSNQLIRKVTASGVVTTLAGVTQSAGNLDGTGTAAQFYNPCGTAVDSLGNVYVADQAWHTIRKITPDGKVSTWAGLSQNSGSANGTGTGARFSGPSGVAVDASGNVYVADSGNHLIRKITPQRVVTTVAGVAGSAGSGNGAATSALFNYPTGVAVDLSGNVYVAEQSAHTIRKITPDGVVSTLAGLYGTAASGDGQGSAARFNQPYAIAVDRDGFVYVAEYGAQIIRKISPAGYVTTIGGLYGNPASAEGVGATSRFNYPLGIAVDQFGNIYVGDQSNQTIRKGVPYSFAGAAAFASSLGTPANPVSGTIHIGSADATGTLLLAGTSLITNRTLNLAGTTGGAVLDQSGEGLVKFTSGVTATGAGSKTLTLQGSSFGAGELAGTIVNNSSLNTTALLKQGSGTWTLSGANSYSGGTTLVEGSLVLGSASALGTGSLTISGGVLLNGSSGALTLAGSLSQTWAGNFAVSGSTALNLGGGAVTVVQGLTVTVNAPWLQLDGPIGGSGKLTKAGNGTLYVAGPNALTSGIQVLGGAVYFSSGTSGGQASVSVGSGSTVGVGAPSTIPNGLVHRWSFSETSGTVLSDSIGSANGSIVTPSGAQNATLIGGSVKLSGGAQSSASYVRFPSGLLSGLTDLTVEVWASLDAVSGWARIFEFGDGSTPGTSFLTAFVNGSDPSYPVISDTPKSGNIVSATAFPTTLGRIYHWSMVWDSSNAEVRWYRDGVLLAQFSESGRTLSQIPDGVFWLGRSHYTADNTAAASFADVRLWNRCLSQDEIAASTAAGANVSFPNLDFALQSSISGAGALQKSGGNTVALTASNSYNGGTTVAAGTLVATNFDSLGYGPVNIASGAFLQLDGTSGYQLDNVISGAGSIVKTGSSAVTLTGASSHSGPLVVRGGSLLFAPGATLSSGSIVVKPGATLAFALNGNMTLSSTISGNVVNLTPQYQLAWSGGALGGTDLSQLTSSGTIFAVAGAPFTYQINGSLFPTGFGGVELPAGVSVNPSTGVISGTVASSGTSSFSVTLTNSAGTNTVPLTLDVRNGRTIIAVDFNNNSSTEAIDATTPKGPLGTKVWNSVAGATGSRAALLEEHGYVTPLIVSWSSPNTYTNGASTATPEGRILFGYLDDGFAGNRVTVTGIPYANYNVYGIVASDNNMTPYNTMDFSVNGTYVFGGSAAAQAPAYGSWEAAGFQWAKIDKAKGLRGNYWKMTGVTGGSLVIQGVAGAVPNRGSLAAILIEGNPAPTITTQPLTQFVTSGGTAVLSAAAIAPGTLNYQWYKDGQPLTNQTNASISF
ncbi:MAG: hypothetical protein EBS01_04025, partial [Verrucomicrobia bacterium]|nr:hypothetical protein [Verrucomicrobiota bacterium]